MRVVRVMSNPDLIPYKLYRDRAHVLPGSCAPPRFCLELGNLTEVQTRTVLDVLRGDRSMCIVNLSDRKQPEADWGNVGTEAGS